MSETMIIVYQDGSFHEEPIPDWLIEADALSTAGMDRDTALSKVLQTECQVYTIAPMGDAELDVATWRSNRFGAYVECWNALILMDAVWVPEAKDWWPFRTNHLLPFMILGSNLALSHSLSRMTNALIAYGRYGMGDHIDRDSGCSRIDARQDERQRALRRQREGK